MNAYEVVGYSYEADLHCPDCARKRFGSKALDNGVEDREGNEVHPIFASDFDGDAENCCDCAYPIFDAEDEDEGEGDCDCDCCKDEEGEECDPDCPGDSAHLDGFCPRAKAEDDPCTVCGDRLIGERAVSYGQCDKCLPCEYCGERGHWGGCKAQERHDRRCL